jgi:hypothetical protein
MVFAFMQGQGKEKARPIEADSLAEREGFDIVPEG